MNDPAPSYKTEGTNLEPGDSVELAVALKQDDLIAERYRVISLIGRGGMGCVYRVEQIFLQKEFALKTLNPSSVTTTTWRRFQKEAKAASVLDHPGLVKVHDFGMIGETQPFLVMDFVDGDTLAARIKTSGAQPLDEVLDLFIQVSLALGTAHRQGVIHRDIKPSNIMISREQLGDRETAKIVDFGIAKVLSSIETESMALTRTGEIFGTPHYMSPEQCLGLAIDQRSDIYSLGCSMFEALAGTPPFMGDSALSTVMKHHNEKPPLLKEGSLGKSFPDALECAMTRLLAKKPEHRYQNLFDLANDLSKIRQRKAIEIDSDRAGAVALQRGQKFDRTVQYSIAAAAIITLTAGAYYCGRVSAPPEPRVGPVENFNHTQIFGEKTGVVSGPFSQFDPSDPTTRMFHFPQNEPLGSIVDVPPSVQVIRFEGGKLVPAAAAHGYIAKGDLLFVHFKPLTFNPGFAIGRDANLMTHFRADEIESFRCDSASKDEVEDKTISAMRDLTGIRQLVLSKSTISPACIELIDNFPHLQALVISGAHSLAYKDVARLKRLQQLEWLGVGSMFGEGRVELLQKLGHSSKLIRLDIDNSVLNDEDLRLISQIPNLKRLDISRNEAESNRGIEYLANAPKLEELYAIDCKVSFGTLDAFKHFRHLKRLIVSDWKAGAQKQFQQDMLARGCEVKFVGRIPEQEVSILHDLFGDETDRSYRKRRH